MAADLLTCVPAGWWQDLCAVWNHTVQTGQVPELWTRAVVTLLPKFSGGCRPLSIASAVWRLGASALVRTLDKPAGASGTGGGPARSGCHNDSRTAESSNRTKTKLSWCWPGTLVRRSTRRTWDRLCHHVQAGSACGPL